MDGGSTARANKIYDNLSNEWIFPILSTTGRTIKDPGVPGVLVTSRDNIKSGISRIKKPIGKAGANPDRMGF